jgi:serine O-acetyltransferase
MERRLFAMDGRVAARDVPAATHASADDQPPLWELLRGDLQRHGKSREFLAIAHYRLGRWAHVGRRDRWHRLAARAHALLRPLARVLTSASLPPTAVLAPGVHLIHCEGPIAIHPHVTIGERVGIMHNVTIGAGDDGGVPRIGDDVFIGVGAVILGNVVVGEGAQIGANSLVVADVPAHHVAIGVPARCYPIVVPRRKG